MTLDEEDGHLVTCSGDFTVRMWSRGLDLWGSIDEERRKRDTKWCFPEDAYNRQCIKDLRTLQGVFKHVKKVPGGGFEDLD